MKQDIREMFREEPHKEAALNKGHEKRFAKKLEIEFPKKKNGLGSTYLKMAVMLAVAVAVSAYFVYQNPKNTGNPKVVEQPNPTENLAPKLQKFELSEVSPQFKKIEDYYLASINLELAKIKINPENKQLIDAFMVQLEDLDSEYTRLNAEMAENGANEQTLEAMISNLQLRLQLLYKLKKKLKELKSSKNEDYENHQI